MPGVQHLIILSSPPTGTAVLILGGGEVARGPLRHAPVIRRGEEGGLWVERAVTSRYSARWNGSVRPTADSVRNGSVSQTGKLEVDTRARAGILEREEKAHWHEGGNKWI
jgi:hypothetical protein